MSKLAKPIADISQRLIVWGVGALIILMPFHAFFSIYLGSIGISQSLVQSWKEVLVVVVSFCWILLCISKRRLYLRLDATNVFFLAIFGLSLIITLFLRPASEAVLFGIKTNIVALVIFLVAQIPIPSKLFIRKHLHWLILIPGVVVAIIAILQSTILPESILVSLGYGVNNINPNQIIDGSLALHRAFSTLGGPNQLGTYLIVPLSFSLVYAIKQKKWWLLSLTALYALAIGLSFSRSAWLGAFVAIIAALLLVLNNRQRLALGVTVLAVTIAGLLIVPSAIKTNPRLENILLHGRIFENRIEGSDQFRLEAISNTTEAIIAQPFGHGLGTAGPASFQLKTPIIPENWFLQIAYEIGVIGLVLYLLAFAALLGDFIRNRKNPFPASLFGLTCGVLVASLFLHSWADSTLVLVVFSLYGLYKGQNI